MVVHQVGKKMEACVSYQFDHDGFMHLEMKTNENIKKYK